MDVQTRRIEFVQKFLRLQNENVISKFEKLIDEVDELEISKEITPFTEKKLNQRVAKSENDFKHGRYKTTDELLEKY